MPKSRFYECSICGSHAQIQGNSADGTGQCGVGKRGVLKGKPNYFNEKSFKMEKFTEIRARKMGFSNSGLE